MYIFLSVLFLFVHAFVASDDNRLVKFLPFAKSVRLKPTDQHCSSSGLLFVSTAAQPTPVCTSSERVESIFDGVMRACPDLFSPFSVSSLQIISQSPVPSERLLLRVIDAASDKLRIPCMQALNQQLSDQELLPFFTACLHAQTMFVDGDESQDVPLRMAYGSFMDQMRARLFSLDQALVRPYIAGLSNKQLWSLVTSCECTAELVNTLKYIDHTDAYRFNHAFLKSLLIFVSSLVDCERSKVFDAALLLSTEQSVEREIFDLLQRYRTSGLLCLDNGVLKSFSHVYDCCISLLCAAIHEIPSLPEHDQQSAFSELLPMIHQCAEPYFACESHTCASFNFFFLESYELILKELIALKSAQIEAVDKASIKEALFTLLKSMVKSSDLNRVLSSEENDIIKRSIRSAFIFLCSIGAFEQEAEAHVFFWSLLQDVSSHTDSFRDVINNVNAALNSLDGTDGESMPSFTWLLHPGFKRSPVDAHLTHEMRATRRSVLELYKRESHKAWVEFMVQHFHNICSITPSDELSLMLDELEPSEAALILNYPVLGNLFISKLKTPSQLALLSRLKELGLDLNGRGIGDKTALMFAAQRGEVELVKALVAHGANPLLVDSLGRSVIGYACDSTLSACEIMQVITALAESSSALLHTPLGSRGLSVLSEFIVSSRVPSEPLLSPEARIVIDCMVNVGASILQEDNTGLTAIDHAAQKGATELVAYLGKRAYAKSSPDNPYMTRQEAELYVKGLCDEQVDSTKLDAFQCVLDLLYQFEHVQRTKSIIEYEFYCLLAPSHGISYLDFLTPTKINGLFERSSSSAERLLKTLHAFLKTRSFKEGSPLKNVIIDNFFKYYAHLCNSLDNNYDRIFPCHKKAYALLVPLITEIDNSLISTPHQRLHKLLLYFHRYAWLTVNKSLEAFGRSSDAAEMIPAIDYIKYFSSSAYPYEKTSSEEQLVLASYILNVDKTLKSIDLSLFMVLDVPQERFLEFFKFLGFVYAVTPEASRAREELAQQYHRLELSIKQHFSGFAVAQVSSVVIRKFLYLLCAAVPRQYDELSRLLNLYEHTRLQIASRRGLLLPPLEVLLNPGFNNGFDIVGLSEDLIKVRQEILAVIAREKPEQFISLACARATWLINRAASVMDLVPVLEALDHAHIRDILNFPLGGRVLISTLSTPTQLTFLPLLLSAGADVNARGSHQQTPLMYAMLSQNGELVERLLAAGADTGLFDDADRTILEYLLLSSFSQTNKLVMIDRLKVMNPELFMRFIGQDKLSPLSYYIKCHADSLIQHPEQTLCVIADKLMSAGVKASAQTCYGITAADMAYQIGLNQLGELCCKAAYDHADDVEQDPYVDRAAALELVAQSCPMQSLDHNAIESMHAVLKLLYKFDHTRVRKSRIQVEIDQMAQQLLSHTESATAASSSPTLGLVGRIVDADGNGLYTTFSSYRNMLLTGTLHAVFKRDIRPDAMREVESLATHVRCCIARKLGLEDVAQISFDDFPYRDQVTLDGFRISRQAFGELLAVTEDSPVRDLVVRAYTNADSLRSALTEIGGIDEDDIEATCALLSEGLVDLAVVRHIVESSLLSPQRH